MGWEVQELREMDANQNETTTFVCLPVGAPLGLLGSLRIPLPRVAPGPSPRPSSDRSQQAVPVPRGRGLTFKEGMDTVVCTCRPVCPGPMLVCLSFCLSLSFPTILALLYFLSLNFWPQSLMRWGSLLLPAGPGGAGHLHHGILPSFAFQRPGKGWQL